MPDLRKLGGPVLAFIAMPVVALGLSSLGFRRVHAAMARWPRPRPVSFPSEEAKLSRARHLAHVVAIAAGPPGLRATCLRRSLVLWWLLRWHGIEGALRVGVRREEGELRAHAWVEVAGRPVNDAEDVALRFPPFERDFGATPEHAG